MAWSSHKPPFFIDGRKIAEVLRDTAAQRAKSVKNRRFIESSEEISADLTTLAPVVQAISKDAFAAMSKGASANDPTSLSAAIRPFLFDDGAWELINTKCRNRYWMWCLLSHLKTGTFPVNALAIARAQARLKDSLRDMSYGFAHLEPGEVYSEGRNFPLGFILKKYEEGHFLADRRSGGTDYGVMLNPLLVDE
jgi:hypothetical protein